MEDTRRAPRRRHSEELKARVLAACALPDKSVAKVALTHGLNANLVHKWRRADEAASGRVAAHAHAKHGGGEFIALTLPQHSVPVAAADIRIELRRDTTTVSIRWPVQGGGDCAAWQRGSNENANGLVREFLPKGMDLSQVSHQQLTHIEQLLNHRPRKILDYRTPHEVFSALTSNLIAGVALQA